MRYSQVPKNTEHIQTQVAYSFYNSLWHHYPYCYASCLIFWPCVCFASIYASTAAKSYILNYMWTVANFINYRSRRLCTVEWKACPASCWVLMAGHAMVWNGTWNGMKISVWNMEWPKYGMEWKIWCMEWNQIFHIPYKFHTCTFWHGVPEVQFFFQLNILADKAWVRQEQ